MAELTGLPSLSSSPPANAGADPGTSDDENQGGQPAEGEEAPEGEQPEAEEGEEQPEAEWEVTEIDGHQVAVPKGKADEIKAGFLKSKDYTTKTQELAEARRANDAEKAELAAERTAQAEFLKDVVKIEAVKSDLDRYTNFTPAQWGELARTNPGDYAAHQANYQRLDREFRAAATGLKAKIDERRSTAQRATAKRIEDGKAAVAKKVPGWNDEAAKRSREAAKSVGFSDQDFDAAFEDPRLVEMAHWAAVGMASTKKATATPLPKIPVVTPLKTVGTRSPAPPAGLSDKLTTDEWMRRYQKQQRQK